MAQDLLAALGARIEAQLNAKDARSRTLEETLKARVNKHPPAPFTLLSDGTKQFGYAHSVDDSFGGFLNLSTELDTDFDATTSLAKSAPTTEEISAAIAPFAALLSGAAQVLTHTASQPSTSVAASAPQRGTLTVPVSVQSAASVAVSVPVSVQVAAPVSTPVSNTVTATITPALAIVTSAEAPAVSSLAHSLASLAEPTIKTAVPSASTTVASPTSIVDSGTAAPFVMLPDGTKQFGYAPTGGLINRVPNVTPPAPPSFGIGATVRRLGVLSDAPMTVTQTDGGFVRATVTDSTGTHIFEFPFNQFELITRAPGT